MVTDVIEREDNPWYKLYYIITMSLQNVRRKTYSQVILQSYNISTLSNLTSNITKLIVPDFKDTLSNKVHILIVT